MKYAIIFLLLTLTSACSSLKSGADSAVTAVKENGAGVAGGVWMAQQLGYLKPEFFAGALVAYAIYDPLAPTWNIRVVELGAEHRRIELGMKRLSTGGDGEAHRIFARTAGTLVEKAGYAGYEELRYEEGIDSTRPFASRIAGGEIRLLKSRQFPEM